MRLRTPFSGGPRFAAEWLVVGLGNPGDEHIGDRHNVGFRVVNELARRAGVRPRPQGATMQIAVGPVAGARAALVKPKTFVNLSGRAVSQALSWTGCDNAHTVVVYDELDLAAGALRIRAGGGTGGHNGLKSISAAAGPEFLRVRVGIGRPTRGGQPTWDPDAVADWVLSAPDGEDRKAIEEATVAAADAIEAIITDGVEAAAAKFNRR